MSVIVKPINAQFLEDSGIGDSDPYVVITIGQEKKKGNVHDNAGKNPQWADTFVYTSRDQLLRVEVWDYDVISSDDLMGEGTMNLMQCYQNPNRTQNQYVDLRKNGKPVGRILLSVEYQGPSMGGNQGNQWGGGNNQGGWGNNQGGNQGGWGGNNQGGNQGGWGNNQGGNQGGWGNNQGGNQGGWGNNQGGNQGGWGNNQGGNQGGWGGNNQGGWGNNNQGWGNNQGGNQGWGNNNRPGNGW